MLNEDSPNISSFIPLLQTQDFSNQHPGFCSCARAHSKYPHPVPDGAESTSLGLRHTYKHSQEQITPNYHHRATQAHPASGMLPREVTSRRQLSPCTELPSCADRAPIYMAELTFCKSHLYRGRTESFRGCCSHKSTSQALEYQPPSIGPILPQHGDAEVQHDCSTAMPCAPAPSQVSIVWSSPLA